MSNEAGNEDLQGILDRHREPEAQPPKAESPGLSGTVPVDVDVYDHSVEDNAAAERERELGVSTPDYPAPGVSPTLHPHVMIDATGGLFGKLTDGEQIRVSPEETERFLRCALHDEEMYFDVQPIAGSEVVVRVAMPTEAFTAYAGALVSEWPDFTGDSVAWVLAMQQAHMWFCVRAVDGKPTKWSETFADGLPKTSMLLQVLRDPASYMGDIFNMGAPRWRMLLEAVRLAEMKTKTCIAAWNQRSFFEEADTAS